MDIIFSSIVESIGLISAVTRKAPVRLFEIRSHTLAAVDAIPPAVTLKYRRITRIALPGLRGEGRSSGRDDGVSKGFIIG